MDINSNVRVRAGSLQEDEDQLGLAHLVEHMAFDSTRDFVGRNAGKMSVIDGDDVAV
jgi:predicted Zn-dependent peptidase